MIKLLLRGRNDLAALIVLVCVMIIPPAHGNNKTSSSSNNTDDASKAKIKNIAKPASLPKDKTQAESDDVFPGGFYLSGFNGFRQWANGISAESDSGDYMRGPVGTVYFDNKNTGDVTYRVGADDEPFGQSWQAWREAVVAGADFYDGDHDGIYNPVDKNGNGVWDVDEDRPDEIGSITYWRVDNDCVDRQKRKFKDVDPLGIEVQRSMFVCTLRQIKTRLLRYRIINSGAKSDFLYSVYFSVVCSSIQNESYKYFVGCDTIQNSIYSYTKLADSIYGDNPPCFSISLFQGPSVQIPGITFDDKNRNCIYDPATEAPLKTAFNRRGTAIGIDTLAGSMNLGMVSFTPYLINSPYYGAPKNQYELRNYMLGGVMPSGAPIEPCLWGLGNGMELSNCTGINPRFMYSGDPVSNTGWLNTVANRQMLMMTTGPFNLEKGKPVDIIVSFIQEQGSNALNSVEVAKEKVKIAKGYFDKNMDNITSVEDVFTFADSYSLEQNYPNPFNPSTTIKYSVSSPKKVTLKVYDLLGKEVATLVNEEKPAGVYQVTFNASNLASGVYLYRLQAGNFSLSKKLLFIK